MRSAIVLGAAMVAISQPMAAENTEAYEMSVQLTVYFDLSGEGEPYVMKLAEEPKTFTFKVEEVAKLSLKMTPLGTCKVRIEIHEIQPGVITRSSPSPWPDIFEPDAEFAVGVFFLRHRQEIRGLVSGLGACGQQAPNKAFNPTAQTLARLGPQRARALPAG